MQKSNSNWNPMSTLPYRKTVNGSTSKASVTVLIKNSFSNYYVGGYNYDSRKWEVDGLYSTDELSHLERYQWKYCDFEGC